MITKEIKASFFKSRLDLFMSALTLQGDGDAIGGFRGLRIRDIDDTTHFMGVVLSGGRPYGVNTTVSSAGDGTHDPTNDERIMSGCLMPDETANGLTALMDIAGNPCVERLSELFAERYLSEKISGVSVFSNAEIEKLSKAIAPSLRKVLDKVLDQSGVDREAVRILADGTAHDPSYKSYAFYSIKDAEKRLLRHQAANSYPALANMMADVMSIRQTIDQKLPLQPALMAADPEVLSKPLLKRLTGNRFGVDRKTLCALSKLPSDWFPKTKKEMDYAKAIIHNFMVLTQGDPVRLLKPSSGRFETYAHTLLSAYSDTRPPEGATEHDMAYIAKAIDFKAFEALKKAGDRETILAMSKAVSQSIPAIPNVPPEALESYINRRYAPDISLHAMNECRAGVEHIIDLMISRVSMPLIAHLSGLKKPPVNYELFKTSRELAEEFLLQQKSPVTALEHFRSLHNSLGLLRDGGPNALNGMLTPLEEMSQEEEEKRIDALGGYTLSPEDIAIMNSYHARTGRQEWPAVFAPFKVGDVAIVPLLSKEDLAYESDVMQNCCSDYYAVKSKTLASLLFSIRKRTENGVENLVTFELNPVRSDYKSIDPTGFHGINIGACLGFKNSSRIPLDAKNIIVRFWEEVVNPYKVDLKLKHGGSARRREIGSIGDSQEKTGIDRLIDYSWQSQAQIARAMEPWSACISKRYRVPISQLQDKPFIKDAIATINPLMASMQTLVGPRS